MRISDFEAGHAYRTYRGAVNPRRAAPMLPRISDGSNDVDNASELLFTGGTVTEPEDGVAQITIGGSTGIGGGASSSIVQMLNNAGQDLLPGDVVIVDGAENTAVTTTTTAADIHIVGVVQEPIADGAIGPVLFNGYAPIVNAPSAVRGEYAQTSTTAKQADSVTDRGAGTFAFYLTGADFPDFVSDSATTTAVVPVESLSINLPATLPAERALFLALWLEDAATSVSIPGWTQIGAEEDFWYFYRISTDINTATATWTGPSVAVASVLLLHPAVSLAVPIEAHDYENTTTAAALSGLSDVSRYAIAGVRADVATPGSGFTLLSSGTTSFSASGTPALEQQTSYATGTGAINVTLPAAATVGNLILGMGSAHDSTSMYLTDPRDGGTCPIDSHATVYLNANTTPGSNTALSLQAYTTADGYAGPFGSRLNCSTPAYHGIAVYEFSGVSTIGAETLSSSGSHNETTVDIGDFMVGVNDLVVMAVTWQHSQSDPGIATDPNGFTTLYDDFGQLGAVGWTWLGYKVGDGDCSFSAPSGTNYWTAIAILFKGGAQAVAGTLAGKYIGHDSSVTSPFSGSGKELDALFAFNLLRDAKPSALLYGPDLGGDGSAITEITNIPTAETDTTLVLHPDGMGGIEWGVDATGGSSDLYINVMDPTYGAVGDGTTDDTTAIQAAIDATPDGATCFFPAGEYKITATLTIPGNIRLLGTSGLMGSTGSFGAIGSTITMATNNTTAISTTDLSKLTVEALAIRNTGTKTSGKGIYALGSVITRHVFVNAFQDGIFIDAINGDPYNVFLGEGTFTFNCTRAGVYLDGKVNNAHITGLVSCLNAYGIYASGGCFGLHIVDSDIEVNTTSGITIDGTASSQTMDSVYIGRTYLEQSGAATSDISIGPTTLVQGVTIDDCYFEALGGASLWHIDVNYADRITVIGGHIKQGSAAGSIRCDSSNTTNVLLVNVEADGTVTTPATTRIIDQTDVTPASVGIANAVGTSKYLARADHVHQGSGGASALDDLSDVTITSATSGDRLRYNGASWVNSALRWEPHVAYDGTVVLDGNGDPVMVEVS